MTTNLSINDARTGKKLDQPGFAPIGALRTWRARIQRDPQLRLTVDAVHAAACMEANGNDAWSAGLLATAEAWYRDAARLVIKVAQRRAA